MKILSALRNLRLLRCQPFQRNANYFNSLGCVKPVCVVPLKKYPCAGNTSVYDKFKEKKETSRNYQTKMSGKVLAAFDFDMTMINKNSDTYIQKLLPNRGQGIKKFRRPDEWIPYMQMVFEKLCECGLKPSDIINCLEEIPLVPGIYELLTDMNKAGHELIIISDCNTVFVESILKKHNLTDVFQKVFVNPSKFKENGCLEIGMYHVQDKCPLSAINLCKGQVLEEYIDKRCQEGTQFQFVAYVGDGSNDYCPSLRLSSKDLVFPRKGYDLEKIIFKEHETPYTVQAKIVPWENGLEIKEAILSHLKK